MRQPTFQEINTILAVLRHLQTRIRLDGTKDLVADYPHFEDVDPLSASKIDRLCEDMYSGHLVILDEETLTNIQNVSRLRRFVDMVARLDTTKDFERRDSVMENDVAVDTVDRLISEARDLVPREVWDSSRDS